MLDSSPLLLFLVGNLDKSKLGGKRLEAFDEDDLERVNAIVREFPVHVSTPNVLTEASNHLGDARQFLVERGVEALALYVGKLTEIYIPTIDTVKNGLVAQLGVADSGLVELSRKGATVVTVDHQLSGVIDSLGGEVINLMHWKTPR